MRERKRQKSQRFGVMLCLRKTNKQLLSLGLKYFLYLFRYKS